MKSITLYFVLLIRGLYPVFKTICLIYVKNPKKVLMRKKSPCSELFWFVSPRIRTEYGQLRSISTYSIQMRENTNQNNSEYGQFLPSVCNLWHKYLENFVMSIQALKWMSGPSLRLKIESWKVLIFIRYGIYSSSFILKRLWL